VEIFDCGLWVTLPKRALGASQGEPANPRVEVFSAAQEALTGCSARSALEVKPEGAAPGNPDTFVTPMQSMSGAI